MKPRTYVRDPFYWLLLIVAILIWIFGASCSQVPKEEDNKFMVVFATKQFRAFVFLYGDEDLNPVLGVMYSHYNGRYIGKFWKHAKGWTIENAEGKRRSFDPYIEIPRMNLFNPNNKRPPPKEEGDESYDTPTASKYSHSHRLSKLFYLL